MGRIKSRLKLKSSHLDLVSSFINHLDYQRKEDEENYYNNYYNGLYPSDEDYWDECYGNYYNGWNYDKDDDDYDLFTEYKNHRKNSKKKDRDYKKKKYKVNEYEDDDEMYYMKTIYYYPDYTDINSRKEFNSLFELDAFLLEEGISVSDEELDTLLNNDLIYCSLNPKSRIDEGKLELIVETNYTDLENSCYDLDTYNKENEEESTTNESVSDYAI